MDTVVTRGRTHICSLCGATPALRFRLVRSDRERRSGDGAPDLVRTQTYGSVTLCEDCRKKRVQQSEGL